MTLWKSLVNTVKPKQVQQFVAAKTKLALGATTIMNIPSKTPLEKMTKEQLTDLVLTYRSDARDATRALLRDRIRITRNLSRHYDELLTKWIDVYRKEFCDYMQEDAFYEHVDALQEYDTDTYLSDYLVSNVNKPFNERLPHLKDLIGS